MLYPELLKDHLLRAERGDIHSQYRLGEIYGTGEFGEKDYAEAAKWTRKAAEQGHAGAQNRLGILYANGLGVTENRAVAAQWFRKAAKQGDADAKANLKNLEKLSPALIWTLFMFMEAGLLYCLWTALGPVPTSILAGALIIAAAIKSR